MNSVINLGEKGIPKNKILTRKLPDIPDFRYLLRLSSEPDPQRVLVVVHGISRQPAYMLRCLESAAQALNYTLIAPEFSKWSYRDYQRLGREGRGYRADIAFDAMMDDVAKFTGLKGPVHLLGFSGGAQFVHRYVYSQPGKVRSLCVAAAGWYTPPLSSERFPYGTRTNKRLQGVSFDANNLISTPTLTVVGENDTNRDPAMRRSPCIDKQQGINRLKRAQWFHQRMKKLAAKKSIDTNHQFKILPATGHNFGEAVLLGGLTDVVFNFCEDNVR